MTDKKAIIIFFHKYEVLIASGVVLVLVLFLVLYLLIPNLRRSDEIYAHSQTLSSKLDVLTKKHRFLSSLDSQYYRDAFLKLNQIIPEGKDFVSLMTTFDYLEKQSGVSLVRTDFPLGMVSNLPTGVNIVPIALGIKGSLESVKTFMDLISNFNGRFMVFDNISVANDQTGMLAVSLQGRAFFYPLPTTLGPVDTPLPQLNKSQEEILAKVNTLSLSTESSVELDKSQIGKKNLFQ